MKLILPGGSGFLGQALIDYYQQQVPDTTFVVLSRRPAQQKGRVHYVQWDGTTLAGDWATHLEGADAVINLAGRTVNCRYTDANKHQILASRLESTTILGEAMRQLEQPPQVWLNSSSATIYEDTRGDAPANTESSAAIGDDFSMTVCQRWEAAFWAALPPGVRPIVLRTTIVLGDGSALAPLAGLAKVGLGGPQAGGNQYFSWLHVRDFVRAVDHLIQTPSAEGIYNLAAPQPVTNREQMRLMRQAVGRSFGLPLAPWMLSVGAFFMGTETELVLKSRKVISERLPESGFTFDFPTLEGALQDLLGS